MIKATQMTDNTNFLINHYLKTIYKLLITLKEWISDRLSDTLGFNDNTEATKL